MKAPSVLVIASEGMCTFFAHELSAHGYHSVSATSVQEARRLLACDPQLVLIFDHFIHDAPDSTLLIHALQDCIPYTTPLVVITSTSGEKPIFRAGVTLYDYMGGIEAALQHIRTVLPRTPST
jgi:DNA-binding NtrC family response regulator